MPTFILVYTKMYGGIEDFDAGKFYHDARIIHDYGKENFSFFIRLLFGLQNDSPGSPDFINCLKDTVNWDNGIIKDYLYNDNRIVIRVHAVFDFIAFNSYEAHALFNCFLSFIGISFIYKTFKEWFAGKEFLLVLILCFWPALWFYTGAVLKEGITLFIMGCSLYQLKQLVYSDFNATRLISILFLLFISFLLKPYLLIFSALCFSLFFSVSHSKKIKRKVSVFIGAIIVLVIIANFASLAIKNRSLFSAAMDQHHKFVGVSKGGVFVSDSIKLIRLTDTTCLEKIKTKKDRYTIKKNTPYMYWQRPQLSDTQYVAANTDTITIYKLLYSIAVGNSNIHLSAQSPLHTLTSCLYYTLFYFNARNTLQILASLENVLILLSLFVICFGIVKRKKENFLLFVFVFFCISLCLLIGLTSPNSGAIFRYRAPAVIFVLMAALYYVNVPELLIRFKSKT